MKAVIVEASGSMAVALREDGSFIKVQNKGYSIGDELVSKARILQFPKQIVAAACSALVILAGAGGVGAYQWNSPYSYVTLDVNPSIEYSLNKFDKVIAVNGLNEAGNEIALSIGKSIKNRDITQALEMTVNALNAEGFAGDIRDIPLIGVYSDNDSKTEALMATASDFSKSIVALTKDDKDLVDSGVSLSEIAGADEDVVAPASVDEVESVADDTVVEDENVPTDSSVIKADDVADSVDVVDEPVSDEIDEVVDASPTKGSDTAPAVTENTTPTDVADTPEVNNPSENTTQPVVDNESPIKGADETPAKGEAETVQDNNETIEDDTLVDVSPVKK